jgi:hypothetical protein
MGVSLLANLPPLEKGLTWREGLDWMPEEEKKGALLPSYKRLKTILKGECQIRKISFEELRMGSRRGRISGVRSEIGERLIKELGMSLAEAARLSGVSTSAISKFFHRIARESNE